jgi:hypothetical protein
MPLDAYARHDLCFTLFSPFCNLGVDLVSQFWFDFARVPGEESEESLCAAIDNVDFVE